MRGRRLIRTRGAVLAGLVLLAAAATGCATGPIPDLAPAGPSRPAPVPSSSAVIASDPAGPLRPSSSVPLPRSSTVMASHPAGHPRPSLPAGARRAQLPRGGTTILPRYRIVAFYGGPDGPGLGVLGRFSPDQAAAAIDAQAAAYAPFGRRIQPAMELIATVAQARPGADGRYSLPIPDADIARYLAAAHRHRMLLILDIQPGRGDFLSQVTHLAPFLADPSVGVALDPEWHVGPTQVPGTVIGSAAAADINVVGRYLSRLIVARHLPDKLLVVHEFTTSMLPDRAAIARPAGVEVVLHADGHSTPQEKIAVYRRLAIPAPPFAAGFKLFYTQDTGLMTPAQVMALRPQPDIVTYE